MRSFWIRRAITASAPVSASRKERATVQPSFSIPEGISVEGPPTRTWAPSLLKQWMLDRATRLCAISPTMATVFPSSVPQRSRRLSASSRPCVGCSWAPSPALITLARTARATSLGAPAAGWRTTRASAPMASRLRTVSSSDSPLATLEASFWKMRTSAPSAFAATSKELRVRVLVSKKRVITFLPRKRPRRSVCASPPRARARSRLKRAASESNPSIWGRVSASSSSRCLGKSNAISDPMQQPPREVRRQARLQDFPGRPLRVVRHPMELDRPGLIVPDPVAGPRIVIARLAAAPDRDQVLPIRVHAHALRKDVPHRLAQLERALQVRMSDESQPRELLGAREQVFRLLEREDVFEGLRIARRGMPVRHLAFQDLVRQPAQPLHVLLRKLKRGPVQHLARGRVVVAVVHAAGDGRVVVAEDGEITLRADQVAGGVGVSAVTNRISKANEPIDLLCLRRGDTRRQRLQVGVDIRQNGGAHRRRPEYTESVLTSSAAGPPLAPRRKRLQSRQIVGASHPSLQLVRVVVERFRHVDPALAGRGGLALRDRQRGGARNARELGGGGAIRKPQRNAALPDHGEDASVAPERLEPEHPLPLDKRQPIRGVQQDRHEIGIEGHRIRSSSVSQEKMANKSRMAADRLAFR